MPKSRKSLPQLKYGSEGFSQCNKCQSILMQEDILFHEGNCPPSIENLDYYFIHNGILYSAIKVALSQKLSKNVSEREYDDIVFISHPVLQLCDIPIGESVVIVNKNDIVVKMAFPSTEKNLMSIFLTKHAIELNNLEGPVKVHLLKSNVHIAKEIVIKQLGKHLIPDITAELDIILKNHNENKIFTVGNRISIPFYGKRIVYKILQIKTDETKKQQGEATHFDDLFESFNKMDLTMDHLAKIHFCKAIYATKWTILTTKDEENKDDIPKKIMYKTEDIGGYDTLISDIKDTVAICIGEYKNIEHLSMNKGILLYGPIGVGKCMIANAIILECKVKTFTVRSADIYSKSLGETESKLKDVFNKAMSNAPSIILLEDIDTLCPKRSNSSTDHERRVLSQLITFLDDLQSTNVLVIATTSKLDVVDNTLRRPGRLDIEFEIDVPTPHMRTEILAKLLSKIPNTLLNEDVQRISSDTHGFVGADLYGLCSKATINAKKRQLKDGMSNTEWKVTMPDFNCALLTTKPSAIKESLVEIPNVKWSDIGGQRQLKLKLEQVVEWPLRHPEAFIRMGTTPPRGVLMFGPPGCSKTMIAKALATESKVNFLNIKGPELFSKWVGESEKAVREVFRKAKQVAPCIVFIDEIDALGSERSLSSNGSGSNVQERVLAQLLTELDGVTALGNVTLVAATNRPDKIDAALLRRLERKIYVGLPDEETRQEIFDIKLRNTPIAKDVDITNLVYLTEGYTGAEIQAICHEAAMKALEENINAAIVTKEHFKAALAIVSPRTPISLINIYKEYK